MSSAVYTHAPVRAATRLADYLQLTRPRLTAMALLTVAVGALLRRFAQIEPAGTPVRGRRARFRGFASYPVRLGR